MTKLDTLITAARSHPTAEERIAAYLAIDSRGLRSAPAFRVRQSELARRQSDTSALELARHRQEAASRWLADGSTERRASCPGIERGLVEYLCSHDRSARSAWYGERHTRRLRARNDRIEVEERHARIALERELEELYVAEIEDRGGETDIVGKYGTETLSVVQLADGLCLLACEGWRQYSSRFGARRAGLAYLCGIDDNGAWAVRVPSTTTTVQDALDYIEPHQVRVARDAGRRILRQGDVYAVESRTHRETVTAHRLDSSHRWDAATRTLTHHPDDGRVHAPMLVPFRAAFYEQRAFGMGRGQGRGIGMAD